MRNVILNFVILLQSFVVESYAFHATTTTTSTTTKQTRNYHLSLLKSIKGYDLNEYKEQNEQEEQEQKVAEGIIHNNYHYPTTTTTTTRRQSLTKIIIPFLCGSAIINQAYDDDNVASADDDADVDVDLQPTNSISSTGSIIDSTPYNVRLTVQLDRKNEITSDIIIEVRPDWAPLASNRFKELIDVGFYNEARFFRVLPNYVAQFGIASNSELNKEWMFCEKNCRALPDEPRIEHNKKGTLSFASSGKNSRQTQVFVNLGNNDGVPNFLDAQGFVPFARVVKGMDDVVTKLNGEYGLTESLSGGLAGSVNQGKAAYYGDKYLDAKFPKLSIIKKAEVIQ